MIPELSFIPLQSESIGIIDPSAAAALAVAVAALAAGHSQRGIGSAAVGALSEDDSLFAYALILTVLPETLIILALAAMVLV